MAQDKSHGPKEAPVDKYPARSYEEAKADPKDIEKVEARATVDQIEDYHDKNPTLKVTKKVEKAISEQQSEQQSP